MNNQLSQSSGSETQEHHPVVRLRDSARNVHDLHLHEVSVARSAVVLRSNHEAGFDVGQNIDLMIYTNEEAIEMVLRGHASHTDTKKWRPTLFSLNKLPDREDIVHGGITLQTRVRDNQFGIPVRGTIIESRPEAIVVEPSGSASALKINFL